MKREDLRVMDLDDEFNDEIVPRPVTDAELAELAHWPRCPSCGGSGYKRLVALDGIDVEALRMALFRHGDGDYPDEHWESVSPVVIAAAYRVLAAIDQEDTDGR